MIKWEGAWEEGGRRARILVEEEHRARKGSKIGREYNEREYGKQGWREEKTKGMKKEIGKKISSGKICQ